LVPALNERATYGVTLAWRRQVARANLSQEVATQRPTRDLSDNHANKRMNSYQIPRLRSGLNPRL